MAVQEQEYILLVEDNPGDAALTRAYLGEKSNAAIPNVRWVQTVEAALRTLESEPGCIGMLLDLGLPDSQGLEGLSAIKAHAPNVPIVVLSGNNSDETGLAAVIAGAQDYLVKGSFDAGLLGRALRYAVHRKKVELALIERLLHDELTGLPKRRLLLDRLEVAMHRCARDGSTGALQFIDLDRFKQINDLHGHLAGDKVLRVVSQRLTSGVRGSDTVARLGGDEFAVLLPNEARLLDALAIGEKLLKAVSAPMDVNGTSLEVSASLNISRYSVGSPAQRDVVIGI